MLPLSAVLWYDGWIVLIARDERHRCIDVFVAQQLGEPPAMVPSAVRRHWSSE